MDLSEIWSTALPLSDAAWEFASPRQQEQSRRAKTRGALEAHAILMRRELIDKIYSEELVAIGIQVSPNLGDAAELIPIVLFADKPDIDWNKSILQAYGRIYESVRVTRAATISTERVEAVTCETFLEKPASKKMGRPSDQSLLREIVQELAGAGAFDGLIQKQRVHVVRTTARERHPYRFVTPTQPSRGPVLRALKGQGF